MQKSTIVVCVLILQGCSFLFVHGPPEKHENLRYFDCTSSYAGPVADTGWALTDGVFFAALASAHGDLEEDGSGEKNYTGEMVFLGVLGVIHIASAIYGVGNAGQCRDAKQHLQQQLHDREIETERKIKKIQKELDKIRGQVPEASGGRKKAVEKAPPSAAPRQAPDDLPAPEVPSAPKVAPETSPSAAPK